MLRCPVDLWLALLCVAPCALADDASLHESAGNLMFVQTHEIAMQRERLVIGPPQSDKYLNWTIPIHAEYDLANTSGQAVQAHVGFPLPACSLSDYLVGKHSNFVTGWAPTCVKEPKMTLGVDGAPVAGRWGFIFQRDGKPLGAAAGDANLSRRMAALIGRIVDPEKRFYKEDPVFLKWAKELCDQLGGQMKEADCTAFKRITVHRTFLWEHSFVAESKAHVSHDYAVAASVNAPAADAFPYDAFCLQDPSIRAAWKAYQEDLQRQEAASRRGDPDADTFPREFFTEYVLRTGALWAAPIDDFELIIRKTAPDQMVSTCFAGLAKTSPVEFRARRTNFRPAEDLRVLYLPAQGK